MSKYFEALQNQPRKLPKEEIARNFKNGIPTVVSFTLIELGRTHKLRGTIKSIKEVDGKTIYIIFTDQDYKERVVAYEQII